MTACANAFECDKCPIFHKVVHGLVSLLLSIFSPTHRSRLQFGSARLQAAQRHQVSEAVFSFGAALFFIGPIRLQAPMPSAPHDRPGRGKHFKEAAWRAIPKARRAHDTTQRHG